MTAYRQTRGASLPEYAEALRVGLSQVNKIFR